MPSSSPTELDVALIEPQNNDRTEFRADELAGLASSIQAVGLIQPITVRPKADHSGFWLIAGERRWRAHLLIGRPTITAIVTDDDDRQAKLKMLVENKAREDLNPIEEARAYAERLECFGDTVESISEATGVPQPSIRWRLGLLRLAPDVQDLIANGQLRHTVGESLIGLDEFRQRAVLKLIGHCPMNLDELWILCERMRAEQNEVSMFDADAFELVAEEMVVDAKTANVALTARQMAVLLHDVVTELDEAGVELGGPGNALVARARAVVEYRFANAKRRPSWIEAP